ncbi:hypothetical protein EAE96_011265 [Botrytis aclada]|nr:hypothetical protein EAE96_011265 [Botrytis aclada]
MYGRIREASGIFVFLRIIPNSHGRSAFSTPSALRYSILWEHGLDFERYRCRPAEQRRIKGGPETYDNTTRRSSCGRPSPVISRYYLLRYESLFSDSTSYSSRIAV